MAYVEIDHLTKDYGKGQGVFNLSLEVEKGEIYSLVGVNGAGKTTTIRHMMGFLEPEEGKVSIRGLDAYKDSAAIKRFVSYVPGEINFPGNTTGENFLKEQIYLAGHGSFEYAQELSRLFQLDISVNVRAMSKGMKQKTALVSALASDAEFLIMDEPSTGLDPLMRDILLELLEEEKQKGKTIFMSSNIFQEVEEVSDKVAVIQDGHIIERVEMNEIRYNKNKTFRMEFKDYSDFKTFLSLEHNISKMKAEDLQVFVDVHDTKINKLIMDLKAFDLVYFKEIKHSLEDHVTDLFKGEI